VSMAPRTARVRRTGAEGRAPRRARGGRRYLDLAEGIVFLSIGSVVAGIGHRRTSLVSLTVEAYPRSIGRREPVYFLDSQPFGRIEVCCPTCLHESTIGQFSASSPRRQCARRLRSNDWRTGNARYFCDRLDCLTGLRRAVVLLSGPTSCSGRVSRPVVACPCALVLSTAPRRDRSWRHSQGLARHGFSSKRSRPQNAWRFATQKLWH